VKIDPDLINAFFEFGGSVVIIMSILQVYRDKMVRGVSWIMLAFFTTWGGWNLYFYPHVGAMWSFYAGILLFITNFVYVSLIVYYIRKEQYENRAENLTGVDT
jgi:uncharacterized membrane protein YfcA